MINLIQNEEQSKQAYSALADKSKIIFPIYQNNNIHSVFQEFSLLFVHDIKDNESYVFSVTHPDLLQLNCQNSLFLNDSKKFIWNKKRFFHSTNSFSSSFQIHPSNKNLIDINLINLFKTNKPLDFDNVENTLYSTFYNWYYNNKILNNIIPLTKHVEVFETLLPKLIKVVKQYDEIYDESFDFFNSKVIKELNWVEAKGLKIDVKKFDERFDYLYYEDDIIHTEYNIYTSTGRPSNHFSGINFAALNKEDGSRDCFISRYGDDGILIEFDWDSYHLRLISKLINHTLPIGSIHEYLGKQYFGIEDRDLTEEEYEESKRISFKLLYGGIPKEFEDIPFFNKTSTFINMLWKQWNSKGYIQCPISNKKIYKHYFTDKEMNKQKLFNYLIQLYEMSRSVSIIEKINKFLVNYDCDIVLYTYDSLLFDMTLKKQLKYSKEIKIKEFISEIKNIMEDNGEFPIKYKIGTTYGNIE